MTAPALIRKPDMIRAAEVAKSTGCRVEIRVGDTVVTLFPEEKTDKDPRIDYSRPEL
ncbi:hypothetical protein D3C87_2049080 [compost metagenome]